MVKGKKRLPAWPDTGHARGVFATTALNIYDDVRKPIRKIKGPPVWEALAIDCKPASALDSGPHPPKRQRLLANNNDKERKQGEDNRARIGVHHEPLNDNSDPR